jgi:FKBP-type peptidyl-prolyl cis-trans isomerase
MNKNILTIVLVIIILIIVAGGIYFLVRPEGTVSQQPAQVENQPQEQAQPQAQNQNQQISGSSNIQGMKVEIVKEGTGEGAKAGDLVTVNYTGTLLDGTKFDSSLNEGRTPFEFTLGQNRVIQGWELGVLGMKVGEKRKLTIPPELAYGPQGAGGIIGPNETLNFEIDLLKIN